ncbi:hypothetical protein G7Z17_g2117 [Cylindrodendrum hubeiense]|uniref:Maltose/galactoside acetyltransferase domain-containing protein n=1 Tax=Cylindrodendrum hubeiense TaxID=595255 RepID=A0A9P5LES0_9HYPO|nr:hypothetical protein G7Z17_g2117 [Cylindrodendrum hubeiense]
MALRSIDSEENKRRMQDGELYYAFTDDLIRDRRKCSKAFRKFNSADDVDRRALVEMWKDINCDTTELPPKASTPEEDEDLLENWPWIEGPIRVDYGYNLKIGEGVFINYNSAWVDTCLITIGARTIMGPNCSFYSGAHPLDGEVRNGTRGPEFGKPITVGEDCWFGGNCIVLPGVTIGKGVTIGAGSVVTKDVPDRVVVAGNPARVIRTLDEK